jgi:hypothetical protein
MVIVLILLALLLFIINEMRHPIRLSPTCPIDDKPDNSWM